MEICDNYSTTLPPLETLNLLKTACGTNLRWHYREKPITMHQTYQSGKPVRFPSVIRAAYAKIWSGKYHRIIIKAPRGGGKSKLLGTVGFDLWFLRDRSVVNMGGSLSQAEIVYGYFTDYCDISASIAAHIDGNITMTETKADTGNFFCCVTASPKSVRGKHPDVLISDETCETSDELIYAALPMVNDSANPIVVMASTFHKIYGIFQETWDAAEERGYLRISWDIFDVALPFTDEVWEREDVRDIPGIEKLRAYTKGRHGDPDGWVSIENIIQAWREKPTEDWFEVEYLGNRPSAAGLVLKPEDVEAAIFDNQIETFYNYVKGAVSVLGIDWGFSTMTSVTELMAHLDSVVVQLDCKTYHQVKSEKIIKDVVEKVRDHGIRFIYADSAGKFENAALQAALRKANLPCKVIEVKFGTEKEAMLGNLRAHFEQQKIKVPKKVQRKVKRKGETVLEWADNKDAIWQLKRYRYQEGTDKPVKKDDHIPDSMMCALQHFKLGQAVYSMKAQEPIKKTEPTTANETKPTSTAQPITAGLLDEQF